MALCMTVLEAPQSFLYLAPFLPVARHGARLVGTVARLERRLGEALPLGRAFQMIKRKHEPLNDDRKSCVID